MDEQKDKALSGELLDAEKKVPGPVGPGTAIMTAPVDEWDGMLNPFADDGSAPAFYTTLDTVAHAHILLAALGNSTDNKDNLVTTPFPCNHLLFQRVNLAKENGAVEPVIRTVLIYVNDETGEFRSVAFVSKGIGMALKFIGRIFGAPPWNPPIPLSLIPVNTRAGRRTYNLGVSPAFVKARMASLAKDAKGKA